MTLFVIILINVDDEVDATYSDSESKDGNANYLEEEYDDDEEDIFCDLEYDYSDSEEEEDQYEAIDFQLYLTKFYVILKKGGENKSRLFSLCLDLFCPS